MPVPAALYYSDGIVGSNSISGREGSSEVLELDHSVHIPLDRQRGTAAGKRIHAPALITIESDTAAPLLYQACCEGKMIAELSVVWFRINETGNEEKYFTHTFKNVRLSKVESVLPNTKDPAQERLTHYTKLHVNYEEIEWKHEEGYEYSDSWKENA